MLNSFTYTSHSYDCILMLYYLKDDFVFRYDGNFLREL